MTGDDEQCKTCLFLIGTDVCRIRCFCGGKWVERDGQKESVCTDHGHLVCMGRRTFGSLFSFSSFLSPTSMAVVGVGSAVALDSVVVLPAKCHHAGARCEGGNAREQLE